MTLDFNVDELVVEDLHCNDLFIHRVCFCFPHVCSQWTQPCFSIGITTTAQCQEVVEVVHAKEDDGIKYAQIFWSKLQVSFS